MGNIQSDALKPFVNNLELSTLKNTHYRHVIYTDDNMQLVLMSLEPGEEIPIETHPNATQFIRVEEGTGELFSMSNENDDGSFDRHVMVAGDSLIIPAGLEHWIMNESMEPLKLYTIYSPPEHEHGTINERGPTMKLTREEIL